MSQSHDDSAEGYFHDGYKFYICTKLVAVLCHLQDSNNNTPSLPIAAMFLRDPTRENL
jgi:hypothetical protein